MVIRLKVNEDRMAASNRMETVVNTYKLLTKNITLNSAKIINVTSKNIFVQSVWSQKNLEKLTNQRFIQNHILNENFQPAVESFPIDITKELLSAISEDGVFKAVLRSSTVDNKAKQYIEIWNKQSMIKNYDLAALDVHGDVYAETEFSTFEWSPDRTKLLYVAEKKLPKSEAFYKQKSLDKKNKEKKEKEEIKPGNEYIYKPDWGEQLAGKQYPVAVVLDIKTDSIIALSEVPDQYSPGQLLWTKDSESIIGVVWIHEPRHLGLIACTNRKSWIFSLNNGEFRLLSKDGCAVRAPKISPNGKYLIWLERSASGPHHNAHRLMYLDLESTQKEPIIITDIVDSGRTIHNEKLFYGIYGRLPQRCWSKDGRYLFYSTPQRTNIRSYIIDMEEKNMIEIENDDSSLTVLDVKDDVIAFIQTSLLKPSTLYIGRLDPVQFQNGNITRVNITNPQKIDGFESLMYEHTIYEYDNDDDIKTFNFTYFGPKGGEDKSVPLVVAPHGGPHSNFVNAFSFDYSFLALMGMAVLQVNYRGSTGMGAKNVEFLQGKVGDVDVKDCVTATNEALNKYPWLSPSNVGVCGGSHGGFLVAHLSSKYPELYKVAVARNPVIDIAAMYTISDIPDWCKAVINMYDDEVVPSTVGVMEMFIRMYNSSPIVLVDRVKAPTLICIGTNDLRVPSSQGKLWYNRLKANKVKTKMLVYEDNHQLGSVAADMDSLINLCLWLMEHNSVNEEDNSVVSAS